MYVPIYFTMQLLLKVAFILIIIIIQITPLILALVYYNSVFIFVCLHNVCKGDFNSHVPILQPNCAEGLHFNVFFIKAENIDNNFFKRKTLVNKEIQYIRT